MNCWKCSKSLANARSLSSHLSMAHNLVHSCRYCFEQFNSYKALSNHIDSSCKSRNFRCPLCPVTMISRPDFNRHLEMCHLSQVKFCSTEYSGCDQVFLSWSALKAHHRAHHGHSEHDERYGKKFGNDGEAFVRPTFNINVNNQMFTAMSNHGQGRPEDRWTAPPHGQFPNSRDAAWSQDSMFQPNDYPRQTSGPFQSQQHHGDSEGRHAGSAAPGGTTHCPPSSADLRYNRPSSHVKFTDDADDHHHRAPEANGPNTPKKRSNAVSASSSKRSCGDKTTQQHRAAKKPKAGKSEKRSRRDSDFRSPDSSRRSRAKVGKGAERKQKVKGATPKTADHIPFFSTVCQYCREKLPSFEATVTHCMLVHKCPYICPHCGHMGFEHPLRSRHAGQHSQVPRERRFRCMFCSDERSRREEALQHMNSTHQDVLKDCMCAVVGCKAVFPSKACRNIHSTIAHPGWSESDCKAEGSAPVIKIEDEPANDVNPTSGGLSPKVGPTKSESASPKEKKPFPVIADRERSESCNRSDRTEQFEAPVEGDVSHATTSTAPASSEITVEAPDVNTKPIIHTSEKPGLCDDVDTHQLITTDEQSLGDGVAMDDSSLDDNMTSPSDPTEITKQYDSLTGSREHSVPLVSFGANVAIPPSKDELLHSPVCHTQSQQDSTSVPVPDTKVLLAEAGCSDWDPLTNVVGPSAEGGGQRSQRNTSSSANSDQPSTFRLILPRADFVSDSETDTTDDENVVIPVVRNEPPLLQGDSRRGFQPETFGASAPSASGVKRNARGLHSPDDLEVEPPMSSPDESIGAQMETVGSCSSKESDEEDQRSDPEFQCKLCRDRPTFASAARMTEHLSGYHQITASVYEQLTKITPRRVKRRKRNAASFPSPPRKRTRTAHVQTDCSECVKCLELDKKIRTAKKLVKNVMENAVGSLRKLQASPRDMLGCV